MRLYVVRTEDFALYLITDPEYVNMSRGNTRFHVEAMFVIIKFVRNM